MGNDFTRINLEQMPQNLVTYPDPPLPHNYHPPFRKFTKVNQKKDARIITYNFAVTDPYEQKMIVKAEVFDKLYDVYNLKTERIFIQGTLKQENMIDRWVFLTTDRENNKECLVIRPYTDQTSHSFGSILCEVYFSKIIANLNCRYLHSISDHFIIKTGIDLLSQPNSHILVMERVDATLSQIISYKRKNLWDWTIGEFHSLTSDLVQGLHVLHQNNITHNDIRPSTIYYSLEKRCYVLGSYGSCMRDTENQAIVRAARNSRKDIELQSELDRKQYDIYLLGITLLCAFYLSQTVDIELVEVQNKKFSHKYQILKLIQAMIAPPSQRVTTTQIRQRIPKIQNMHNYMYEMICSLKHRQRPSPAQAINQKVAMSWAYQNLGLWNQWKREYEEAFLLTQTSLSQSLQAEGKMNLALIQHCRGQFRDSDEFAKQAARKYRSLGERQLDQGCIGAAQSYYKKAVSCAKFYELNPDPDLAQSLAGLSLVHKDRSSYKYAKTLAKQATAVILKAQGRNTVTYGQFKIKQARLQTQFGQYETAQKIIEDCLNLSARLKQINLQGSMILKAQSLVAKAKNYDKWGALKTELQQHSILDKSKTAARQAAQTYQHIDQDHYLELADVVKTVGDINIKRRNYYESIRQYSRAVDLINSHLEHTKKTEVKDKAQILCLRGTAHSLVGEHDLGINDYLQALRIYSALYGSHHNRCSALAIGNLASLYLNTQQIDEAKNCLKTAMQILGDVASQKDADYLVYERMLDQLEMNL